MDEQFIRTPKVSKLIKELRGGSLIETAITLVVILIMWGIMGVGINGFQPNPHVNVRAHLQWFYGNNSQPGQF